MNWPEPLILASTSPRRRELLALAGIDAITLSPKIDDSHFVCGTMSPREWVTTLAILKASSICGSSDKYVPGEMNGLDLEFEKFKISEPVGLSLHCFDFVVDAFQRTGADRAIVPG